MAKWVYAFEEGGREMKVLLGGKGANIAEMTRVLGAERVPAGFTITTEACVAYMNADRTEPEGLSDEVDAALAALEEKAQKRLGDAEDPLLVSVRSGGRESMPGMLDTVLNLGLTDESVAGIGRATGDDRFAWDSFRRFVQMFGNVVHGVPGEEFESAIQRAKADRGVREDTELDAEALHGLVDEFRALYEFPTDPRQQLAQAIRAVFDSWTGNRAQEYRRINRIPDDWGTAVNVQQMVFGNKGAESGSGVAFSRDEVTGEPEPSGDFLANAQGEDVVSGVRTPRDISELADVMPGAHTELMEILRTLEGHYRDMQDTEFTVEEGRLYMLQTRSAKRPAQAAVRFAVDAVGEGLLTREAALMTLEADRLDALLHPGFDPQADFDVIATGVAASPGAAKGAVVFTAEAAVEAAGRGEDVILVRPFTEADDVAGFHAARGILTSEGGKASHAALVARGMGRPCVAGAADLAIDVEGGVVRVGERKIAGGELIAIDGSTGRITLDDVPLVEAQMGDSFRTVLAWADDARRLGVRANADTPEDAARARDFGAQGIGLCRTEHMFFGEDRQPAMVRAILHGDADALDELGAHQQKDFEGLFDAMRGLPVTIRLLDPPLHEFLPHADALEPGPEQDLVRSFEEVNPMLGTRGVRLAILEPELYAMQVAAMARAFRAVRERTGEAPLLEIMIPLVCYEKELEVARDLVVDTASAEGLREGEDFLVGTMIELPRACALADRIASHADFLSFGTNDLTQTALGFSRDDAEGHFLPEYLSRKIIERSPFETIDAPGVGQFVRMAAWLGRTEKEHLQLGICGEHGGDPDSIDFFHHSGIDYVSCSPFRVPIARVAAGQSAIRGAADTEA